MKASLVSREREASFHSAHSIHFGYLVGLHSIPAWPDCESNTRRRHCHIDADNNEAVRRDRHLVNWIDKQLAETD